MELWDANSQAEKYSVSIPDNGDGYLTVDSSNHSAYLLDDVNQLLYLLNLYPLTPTSSPTFQRSGSTVTITAGNAGDKLSYSTAGIPGFAETTVCTTGSCQLQLTETTTSINASEEGASGIASNDVLVVFAATQPTTTAVVIATPSAAAAASDSVTATVIPEAGVTSLTGSVLFQISSTTSNTPSTLCAATGLKLVSGTYQVTCPFTTPSAGSYTVTASYSGDSDNLASSGTANLSISAGSSFGTLGTIPNSSAVVAISQSNPGAAYSAFLNADSSVGLLQKGALGTQSCPAFSNFSPLYSNNFSAVSAGGVYVDGPNNRIYLAMLTNVGMYLAYESIDPTSGTCTQSALVPAFSTFNNPTSGLVAINVDPVQGNMYAWISSGGVNFDMFFVVPTPASASPWITTTPVAQLQLDYSATYGPIVIDSSTHVAYIDDQNQGSSFFVYDPNQTATPAKNLQWVSGYMSGGVTTPFNAQILLTDEKGKLILVNENPSTSSTSSIDTTPIVIIDTSKISFFTGTTPSHTYTSPVIITANSGISSIAAATQYDSIGGADINVAADTVYVFAYNESSFTPTGPGELLAYTLTSGITSPETVLNSNVSLPGLYDVIASWSQLTYDPVSTQIALWAQEGSSAVAASSPLCAGAPITIAQLASSVANPTLVNAPVVNYTSGYIYAVTAFGFDFIAPPSTACGVTPPPVLIATSTSLTATPATAVDGETVVLNAIVSPASGSGTPTGTVTFSSDDSTAIPSESLNSSGATTSLTSAFTPGLRTITADYGGDSIYDASSAITQVTILPAPPIFTPAGGNVQPGTNITITAAAGAKIYYTVDGSTPSSGANLYVGAFALSGTSPITVKAIAVLTSGSEVFTSSVRVAVPAARFTN